tara:strand:- start:3092 stop:3814 length:723 start_codon:yes stop_codon:yes gene_type:complete
MILISGMHRSGTSLVAKLLYEAGADFGNPEGFYPPDKWNRGGYFEQKKIIRLNMKLLHGRWGRLAYLRLPSVKTILSRGSLLNETLKEVSKEIENQVIKENRFCITLPAWQQAGLKVDKVIICLRYPWDVVFSLYKRNHLPYFVGFRLWHEHLQRILRASEGINRRLFLYDNVIKRSKSLKELNDILKFMDIYRENQESELILKECVREPNASEIQNSELPRYVQTLWDQLVAQHKRQSE